MIDFENGFALDIEGDNLYLEAKRIWYINCRSFDGRKELELWPYRESKEETAKKLLDFIDSFSGTPVIAFHHGLGYDLWMLWKHLDLDVTVFPDTFAGRKVRYVDTHYLSRFINPDRPSHSLEDYGREFGDSKIEYHDFSQYTEEMRWYCKQDVKLCVRIYKALTAKANEIYADGWDTDAYKYGQKTFWLMQAQAFTGVYFNYEYAEGVRKDIEQQMLDIEKNVLPQLPPRKLKLGEVKFYTMPAKPYKMNGDFSSHMYNFIEKHSAEIVDGNHIIAYGKQYRVEGGLTLDVKVPMELKDQEAFKDWLIEQGWKPQFYNIKRDSDGKPVRNPETKQVEKTSPKLQENGQLDPGLLELEGDLVKQVVKYLSLKNRLGILDGWLNNPRLKIDHRLSARATGITNTHRQAHAEVCNVPKASAKVLFGIEFRTMFGVAPGNVLIGTDASGLEQRTAAHYTFRYDNGAYGEELLKGDVHSKVACAFFPEETAAFDYLSPDFNKDHPAFKPYRDKAKGGGYAILYGASPAKLATVLGKDEEEGRYLVEAFWDSNPALKELKKNVETFWSKKGLKKYLFAIDKRVLCTRSKHSLLNMLFQSCGAIAMDYACCLMDEWLGGLKLDADGKPFYMYKGCEVRRVIYYHDEYSWETAAELAQEIADMTVEAIRKAGELLGLKVALAGEAKIGTTWASVH